MSQRPISSAPGHPVHSSAISKCASAGPHLLLERPPSTAATLPFDPGPRPCTDFSALPSMHDSPGPAQFFHTGTMNTRSATAPPCLHADGSPPSRCSVLAPLHKQRPTPPSAPLLGGRDLFLFSQHTGADTTIPPSASASRPDVRALPAGLARWLQLSGFVAGPGGRRICGAFYGFWGPPQVHLPVRVLGLPVGCRLRSRLALLSLSALRDSSRPSELGLRASACLPAAVPL